MTTFWPCDALPVVPPAIGDALSNPQGDALLDAVLASTPRGPVWGTDEQGDGRGASPEQLKVWRAIGRAFAGFYSWAWEAATQAFPSAITFSVEDWERELGLPDPCAGEITGTEARKLAIRARLAAIGGASPAYFVCVARAAGFDITIEEPTGFECGASECGGPDECVATDPEQIWIVRPEEYRMFEFECGAGGGELGEGGTRLVDYTDIIGLECVLRRVSPVHTQLVILAS